MPTRSKRNNEADRGAGTGIIKKGAVPFQRGYWNVYETTTPYIGLFDRSLWLETSDVNHDHNSELREAALEDLSYFFDDNMKDNLIMLDFSHIRVMGGVATINGECRTGQSYREAKERNKRRKPKFPELHLTVGYELRLSERDAVTFLTLWKGYSVNKT